MIPRMELAPGYSISQVIKGGWHLAGDHGEIDPSKAVSDMAQFVEAGITTFDCADIYTGVEALIGRFLKTYPSLAPLVQIHTKFVPDLNDLATVDRAVVEQGVDRSLKRLGREQLDVVQFHWWNFNEPRYVETALELDRLRQAGKIRHLAVTNFDVAHLKELTAAGIPLLTHQLQYSLVDDRPNGGMTAFCRAHGIAVLCYGSVAGGFLSERWLGQAEPAGLTNRSLIKYKLIIDDFGGWDLFQELLQALLGVARKHGTDIATVASRMILDREPVAAVIVGATNTNHLASHVAMGSLRLDEDDLAAVASLLARRQGPLGDIYELERDHTGPHARIMKYDLNHG